LESPLLCTLDGHPVRISVKAHGIVSLLLTEDPSMKMPMVKVALACAICLLGGALGTAMAQESAAPNPVKVSLADLDLSTREGVRTAYERVRRAARRVCAKVANSADIQAQLNYITCIDDAMAPAVARIDRVARNMSAGQLAQSSAKP
jgi:UrcA family protein